MQLKTFYLDADVLSTFLSSIFTVSSSFPPFMHRYLVFDLITFILLLSNTYLQDSNLRSNSSLVSSQITISSANSIVHGGSLLTSFVSLSIITANSNGLCADPWCSTTLILKLSVVPTAHLTTVSLSLYISYTSRTYFPLFLIFSYSTTALSAEPCRKYVCELTDFISIYFLFIFIFLTRRKATQALIQFTLSNLHKKTLVSFDVQSLFTNISS